MAPISMVQPRYLLGLHQSSNTKFNFWNLIFFVCPNYVLLLFDVWMGGTIILGTLGNANKYCICSCSIMGLLWNNSKRWIHIEQVFFPFHHNTFNYLLPNRIISPLHMQAFIEYKLIHLQNVHQKFNMQWINNEKLCEVHSFICNLSILHTNIMHWKHVWHTGNVLIDEHFTCRYHVLKTCFTHE
jgi:hypothetical protein